MTIRIPKKNVLDQILELLGKEREVIVPEGSDKIYKDLGAYVQVKAKRESFIKALFRKQQNLKP